MSDKEDGLRAAAGQHDHEHGIPLDTGAVARNGDPWYGFGWCYSAWRDSAAEAAALRAERDKLRAAVEEAFLIAGRAGANADVKHPLRALWENCRTALAPKP